MSKADELCTYCDGPAASDDHVPPKLLFPLTAKKDLIAVRSCIRCNGGASRDDEYLRSILVVENRAATHPEARAAYAVLKRSLRKPEAKGWNRSFYGSLQLMDAVSPSGDVLGAVPTKRASRERIDRVVARVVRGLFREHSRQRLPPSYLVHVVPGPGFGCDESEVGDLGWIRSHLGRVAQYERGTDAAFRYRFRTADDDARTSVWWLQFYGAVAFGAIVGPPVDEPA